MKSLRCFADEMPRTSSLWGLQVLVVCVCPATRGEEEEGEKGPRKNDVSIENGALILTKCFFSGCFNPIEFNLTSK